MEEHNFSVVEFLQCPHPGRDGYVCVPNSWIITRRELDNKVCVLYPEGDKAGIEKMVKLQKKISAAKCNEYLCQELYKTNDYNDGKIFILLKCNNHPDKQRSLTLVKRGSGKHKPTAVAAIRESLKRLHSECNTCTCHNQNMQNVPNTQTNTKTIVFLKQIGELTTKLAEIINVFADSFTDPTVTANDVETNDYQADGEEDADDDNHSPSKRRLSSFELPPEYNENDSRWTLKHRGPAENLRELMEGTGVYIDDKDLVESLKHSKDELELTRALLLAIFTKDALAICSITGSRAFAYKIEDIRPGLDRNAKDVILTFVHWYGSRQNWEEHSDRAINAAIRNKLSEYRKKRRRGQNY